MPTRGRPEFAKRAVDQFAAQTYADLELIILDDTDVPSFPQYRDYCGGVRVALWCTGKPVSYWRVDGRLSVGAKRNIACSRARGEIICHWDDDDISAPGRIADQVARLLETGKQVTGYSDMEFVEPDGTRWMYTAPESMVDYALGTSLMYRRDYWREHAFESLNVQEDNQFVWAARVAGSIVSVPAHGLMTATIHPGNTSVRQLENQTSFVRIG